MLRYTLLSGGTSDPTISVAYPKHSFYGVEEGSTAFRLSGSQFHSCHSSSPKSSELNWIIYSQVVGKEEKIIWRPVLEIKPRGGRYHFHSHYVAPSSVPWPTCITEEAMKFIPLSLGRQENGIW